MMASVSAGRKVLQPCLMKQKPRLSCSIRFIFRDVGVTKISWRKNGSTSLINDVKAAIVVGMWQLLTFPLSWPDVLSFTCGSAQQKNALSFDREFVSKYSPPVKNFFQLLQVHNNTTIILSPFIQSEPFQLTRDRTRAAEGRMARSRN